MVHSNSVGITGNFNRIFSRGLANSFGMLTFSNWLKPKLQQRLTFLLVLHIFMNKTVEFNSQAKM